MSDWSKDEIIMNMVCDIRCDIYGDIYGHEQMAERIADHIDALEAENKALRDGLAFYANPKTYEGVWDRQFGATVYEIMSDSGRRARALLAKGEK